MSIDALLSAAFEGGSRRRRELRLSDRAAAYIKENYPVSLRPLGEGWYEITFEGMH